MKAKQFTALFLTLALFFSLVPTGILASEVPPVTTEQITAVTPLAPEIASQSVAVNGTPHLPPTLSTTVTSTAADGTIASEERDIAALWQPAAGQTLLAAGTVVYTASLEEGSPVLAAGLALPQISVMVVEPQASPEEGALPVITSFALQEDMQVALQAQEPTLQGTVSATLENGETANVAVSWHLPEGEAFSSETEASFLYTAQLSPESMAAYTVQDGVLMPTLTVSVAALTENPDTNKIISAFVEPEVIEIPLGDTRSEADIIATFPTVVLATVDGVPNTEVPVTVWELVYAGTESGTFSAEEQAEIFYEPTLAAGYTLSGEAILPNQKVQVGEALVHEPAPAVGTGAESFSFEVTVEAGDIFRIPLSGGTGTNQETPGNYGKPYNWSIDWDTADTTDTPEVWYDGVTKPGDGAEHGSENTIDSDGIPHTYATAGTYEITITNNMLQAGGIIANNDAWLAAFGFYSTSYSGDANDSANKAMVTAITSPITPLMTRTAANLDSTTPIHNEWESAFYGCTNLKDIGSGFSSAEWANITAIGHDFAEAMFYGCTSIPSIPDTFTLPVSNKVTTVGENYAFEMFNGCTSLETVGSTFTLPQSPVLETIGSGMGASLFSGCTKLTKMGTTFNTPQSSVLESVGGNFGSGMFRYCKNLKNMGNSFLLPSSNVLKGIGSNFAQNMFEGCTSLEEIKTGFTLPQSNALTVITNYFAGSMFSGCTSLEEIPSTFQVPKSNIETIGNSFLSSMFRGCTSLTSTGENFTLPQADTIERIGDNFANYMFNGCTSLTTIDDSFNLPQSTVLRSVGRTFAINMFNGCEKLTTLGSTFTMPQSNVLETVGEQFGSYMFNGCKELESIGNTFNLPQSEELTSIGNFFASNMFENCTKLNNLGTTFNLPQSEKLTTIGYLFADEMFRNCTSLKTLGDTLTLPQSQVVTKIGRQFAANMFNGCSSLESLGANFNLPTSPLLANGNAEAVDYGFAYEMFANAGKNLVINDVFQFTRLSQEQLDNAGQYDDPSFGNVFATTSLEPNQTRTVESIINGNGIPSSQRNTFSNQSAAFSDWNIMALNWGGGGMHTVTYQNNTTQNITPSSMPPQGQIADGQPATRPADAQADGYVLENWYADNTLTTVYNFSAPINANVTVYAGWGCTTHYETNGGTVMADDIILAQRPLPMPTAPTRAGFIFDGWYADAALQTPYDFAAPVTEETTLYAKWNENTSSSSGSSGTSSSSGSSESSSSSSSSNSSGASGTTPGTTTALSPQTGVYA